MRSTFLDRISINLFEKTYTFWTNTLTKYNKYLQSRILNQHIDTLLEDVTDPSLKPLYKVALANQLNAELAKLTVDMGSNSKGLTPNLSVWQNTVLILTVLCRVLLVSNQ